MIDRWVAYWNTEEAPTPLAAVRIAVGLVIAGDLLTSGALGLVPFVYHGWGAWLATLIAALMVSAGVFTPLATVALVLASAQLAHAEPTVNRAVDVLLRNVLLVLVFSAAGQTWSVDCRRRTGTWTDSTPAPAWPRKLLVVQLVAVYFVAGVTKFGLPWTWLGDYSALWMILHKPHYGRWSELPDGLYPLTQLGTAGSAWWEMTFPAIYFGTRTRIVYVGIGVLFHVMLIVLVRLGSFPYGVLALYPVFFSHEQWAQGLTAVRTALLPSRAAG